MKNLNKTEIKELYKVHDAIEKNLGLAEIKNTLAQIKPKLTDADFAWAYAACLLATHHRESEAMELFALNKEDIFCRIMYEYLEEIGEFTMVSKVFKDAKPYHIYTQTPLYQSHEAALLKHITRFAKKNPPPKATPITIIDIGPGDGELTAQYVKSIINLYHPEKIRLIFIDPFEEELKAAADHCKSSLKIESEIITICTKVQNITEEEIKKIIGFKPVWFVNAALSVHHMPEEQKIPMLRQMLKLSPNFILAEVNWNHDLPEKDSPELIYSVVKNYGFFCEGVLSLPVSEADRKLCLYHFPVDEAINIMKQTRENRIDYHTPIKEWKRIAQAAGFQTHEAIATYLQDDEPYLFMLELFSDE